MKSLLLVLELYSFLNRSIFFFFLFFFYLFCRKICHHVSHPGPVTKRYPWEAVDRKVSASKTNYLADETQYTEASWAWGWERILDQPAVHDCWAGVPSCLRAPSPELAQDQRGKIYKFPWTQTHHRSLESSENHQDVDKLMWEEKQHAKTVFIMWQYNMFVCKKSSVFVCIICLWSGTS